MEDFSDKFNTPLTRQEEGQYQQFIQELSDVRGHDMSNDNFDYDMRGYFKNGGDVTSNGHFPDEYKKPNHPTFSDQSIYHGSTDENGIQYLGGQWGNGTFTPSKSMLENTHDPDELKQYFKEVEPDTKLVLPNKKISLFNYL